MTWELVERTGGKGGGKLGAGCRALGGGVGAGDEALDDMAPFLAGGLVESKEVSKSGAEIKCCILVRLAFIIGCHENML